MREGNNSYIDNRKVPQILALANRRAEEWSNSSWKWLTRLRSALLQKVSTQHRRSCRTLRSEQRQAIYCLLKVVLSYLDLTTLCVGVRHQESQVFTHLSLAFFAKKSGLHIRRVQRAMQWLCNAGYIIPYRRSFYDIETEQYYHQPSIRRINPILFKDLGISPAALRRAREHASHYLRKLFSRSALSCFSSVVSENKRPFFDKKSYYLPLKGKENPKADTLPTLYLQKIQQLIAAFPSLTFFEAQRLLPPAHTYK